MPANGRDDIVAGMPLPVRLVTAACSVLLSSCGWFSVETDELAERATATPIRAPASSVPTASTAPTQVVLPTKPTPCPFNDDTTAVNVSGTLTWNGAPLAGVVVEAFQPGAPGRGPAEATATSGADGSYRLTGLRAHIPYAVNVMEQPGFLPRTGAGVALCEKRDTVLAPISAYRTIEGLSLQRGATVIAGSQTLRWQPLGGADEYCVVINTPGDQTSYKLWTPQECSESPPFVRGARLTDPQYVSPSLPAGSLFDLGIYARAKGEVIGVLPKHSLRFAAGPIGNVGPCANTTVDSTYAENIPYRFFQALDQSAVAEVVTCLADAVPDRDALAKQFVASAGATLLQFAPLPRLADGSLISIATVRWKAIDLVGAWRSGETRWLVVRRQSDGRWAMEIASSAPR